MSVIFGAILASNSNFAVQSYDEIKKELNKKGYRYSHFKNNSIFLGKMDIGLSLPYTPFFSFPSINNRYIIASDSILYNKLELAKKIGITKSVKELSDQELIAYAYEKWSSNFVHHLNGDFIILIHDTISNATMIFRDPLGIRPFYYYFHQNNFFFSSQLNGLLAISKVDKRIDFYYLQQQIAVLMPPSHETTSYKFIKRLAPGHLLTYTNKKLQIKKYHQFNPKKIRLKKDSEYLEVFQEYLQKAVSQRILSKDKIGAHFSGGLDSGGINAIATPLCKQQQIDLYSFTLALPNQRIKNRYNIPDERDMTGSIKHNIKLQNQFFVSGNQKPFFEQFDTALELHKSPSSIESFGAVHFINEKASQLGISNILSGFGGDEGITLNHPPYYIPHLIKDWQIINLAKATNTHGIKKVLVHLINSIPFLKSFFENQGFKLSVLNYQELSQNSSLLMDKALDAQIQKENHRIFEANNLNGFIGNLLKNYLIAGRLENESAFSFSHKVQITYPWLDLDLINFFLSIPETKKYQEGKGRLFYRQAISKWTNLNQFINQRNSRTSTIPAYMLSAFDGYEEIKGFVEKYSKKASYDFINWKQIQDKMRKVKKISHTDEYIYSALYEVHQAMKVVLFLEKFG